MLLAAACIGVVAGAMLQAATGFGFSLVAAPLLFAAIGPEPAVVLLMVLGLEVNVLTLATERRRPRPLWRDATAMLVWAAPGALAGVWVLRSLPAVALQVAVTLGVLGTLAARRVRSAHVPAWLAGLAAGALSTSTSTNGPPMLLHLLGRGATPEQVRDTLTVCFVGLATDRRRGAVPDRRFGVARRDARGGADPRRPGRAPGRPARLPRLAASERYEPVLTSILIAAVVVGLIGALA